MMIPWTIHSASSTIKINIKQFALVSGASLQRLRGYTINLIWESL